MALLNNKSLKDFSFVFALQRRIVEGGIRGISDISLCFGQRFWLTTFDNGNHDSNSSSSRVVFAAMTSGSSPPIRVSMSSMMLFAIP